jgi:hypothetical protein
MQIRTSIHAIKGTLRDVSLKCRDCPLRTVRRIASPSAGGLGLVLGDRHGGLGWCFRPLAYAAGSGPGPIPLFSGGSRRCARPDGIICRVLLYVKIVGRFEVNHGLAAS